MIALLKRSVARLPALWQDDLKRLHFRLQIRMGRFRTDEPEYALLPTLLAPGDWALDVGANIGHYTARMSQLTGASGRIIAFEPIPATFALLAGNVRLLQCENVTLLNVAASSSAGQLVMVLPRFDTGLTNYYEAEVVASPRVGAEKVDVLGVAIDSLGFDGKIRLVKVDAEGHEPSVVQGMLQLLRRDRPHLIIEGRAPTIEATLREFGYSPEYLAGSPNTLFRSPIP